MDHSEITTAGVFVGMVLAFLIWMSVCGIKNVMLVYSRQHRPKL